MYINNTKNKIFTMTVAVKFKIMIIYFKQTK